MNTDNYHDSTTTKNCVCFTIKHMLIATASLKCNTLVATCLTDAK